MRGYVLATRAHDAADLGHFQGLTVGDVGGGQRESGQLRQKIVGVVGESHGNAIPFVVVSSAEENAGEPACRRSAHPRVPARRHRGTTMRSPNRTATAAARNRNNESPSGRTLLRLCRPTACRAPYARPG